MSVAIPEILRLFVVEALPAAPVRPARLDLREEELPAAPVRPAKAKSATTCSADEFMKLNTIDQMVEKLSSKVLALFPFSFWKEAN